MFALNDTVIKWTSRLEHWTNEVTKMDFKETPKKGILKISDVTDRPSIKMTVYFRGD